VHKGYRIGIPWITTSEVANAAGLSDGRARAALGALAVQGLAVRGLFDTGTKLEVRWKGQFPVRTSAREEEVEAAEWTWLMRALSNSTLGYFPPEMRRGGGRPRGE
jgi:hypothetical protein